MKKLQHFSTAGVLAGASVCMALFSFSLLPGAHSFQVYLDNKLMLEQYVSSKTQVPKLWIDPASSARQLSVRYNECGRTVSGRRLAIHDDKGKVLKEWQYEGTTSGFKDAMTCPVKDILSLKPEAGHPLELYYSSNDFSQGQLVVHLMIGTEPRASLK